MKKLLLLLLLFCATSSVAQQPSAPYQWPIRGAKVGTDIICAPQGYIKKGENRELNFGQLFIGAPEGTVVVAPVDGTVFSVSISYLKSLDYMTGFGVDLNSNFDQAIAKARQQSDDKSLLPQYLSGQLAIKTHDGETVWIGGLTGDRIFKTGQKITRGEPIGRVGYCYRKIAQPSIIISVSAGSGSVKDPMAPFGLKSSFIAPQSIKPITTITRQQAVEDFSIYINTLKEAYPGLYSVISPEELERYVGEQIGRINAMGEKIEYAKFRRVIYNAIAKIHDSHIYLHPTIWSRDQGPKYQPNILIGCLDDTLRCTNATKPYEHLIGKQVLQFNGLSASQAVDNIRTMTYGYDAKVESYKNYNAATHGFGLLFLDQKFDMTVRFADGTQEDIPSYEMARGEFDVVKKWNDFYRINYYPNDYSCYMIDATTAYIGLSTFELNQTQVENIAKYIETVAAVPNLIIDVRNNGGGDVEVLKKLYSYIAGEPFTLNSYERVNRQRGYANVMKYSLNYTYVDEMFPDYVAEQGREGFYLRPAGGERVVPDSAINFKGRVYVLTNENSVSAATAFPALLVRNHRGVVVGRETRTAYHFMNAIKFADIRLPNSWITLTIPLVEVVFDTAVNARVPYGRGVIPDYEVPITLREMEFTDGDAILNHALQLIKEDKYLPSENPFAQVDQERAISSSFNGWYYAAGAAVALCVMGVVLVRRRKCKTT